MISRDIILCHTINEYHAIQISLPIVIQSDFAPLRKAPDRSALLIRRTDAMLASSKCFSEDYCLLLDHMLHLIDPCNDQGGDGCEGPLQHAQYIATRLPGDNNDLELQIDIWDRGTGKLRALCAKHTHALFKETPTIERASRHLLASVHSNISMAHLSAIIRYAATEEEGLEPTADWPLLTARPLGPVTLEDPASKKESHWRTFL